MGVRGTVCHLQHAASSLAEGSVVCCMLSFALPGSDLPPGTAGGCRGGCCPAEAVQAHHASGARVCRCQQSSSSVSAARWGFSCRAHMSIATS